MQSINCKNCNKLISQRNKSGLCRSCAKLGFNALNPSKKLLIKYYNKQQKSLRTIGKIFKCYGNTILRYLKIYKIARRNQSETNKIRPFLKITKLKIAKKAKKRFKNPENNPMFGKKHTQKSIIKMIKNRIYLSGKNHHSYNPNITNKDREDCRTLAKYKKWVQQVFKRDNYTCQTCGDNRGHNLEAHHLEGYHWCKELKFDNGNGICLCKNCHKKFHNTYGYGYNTTSQFISFTNKIIRR